jgi:hypothetical protein
MLMRVGLPPFDWTIYLLVADLQGIETQPEVYAVSQEMEMPMDWPRVIC